MSGRGCSGRVAMSHFETEPESPVGEDEASHRPRRRGGVALVIAFVGLGLVIYLLWDERSRITYWLRDVAPIDLGTAAAYFPDRAQDNVLAALQVVPGPVADRFSKWGRRYEIVAARGTSILVCRELKGPEVPSFPDQTPFTATGRLLRDTSIPSFGHAFHTLVERGEAVPYHGHLWVLLDGEMPRPKPETLAFLGMLAAIGVLNVVSIVRYFRRR